ncbi:MAG: hypothetical protein GPJ52_09280 [Candidatus Heimdallarchaeota archaeon]|nr:hypothetical protein [Candidatus Heimdallarchaeota archaeon]
MVLSRETKSNILIAIILISSVFTVSITAIVVQRRSKNDYFQGEIVIKKDEDFVKRYHLPGEGTPGNPYLLENLEIDTQRIWGIAIMNTSKYFVIRNCTIKAKLPIYIESVAPSTTKITDNIINIVFHVEIYEHFGIFVQNSDGCLISNNFIDEEWSCEYGIRLISSFSSEITNNTCNGITIAISLLYCQFTSINGNTLTRNNRYGIFVEYSDFIVITNNLCLQRGLSGIHAYQTSNLKVTNNNCSEYLLGIWLWAPYPTPPVGDSIISNNICSNNTYDGIWLNRYGNCLIEYNIFKNNTIGLNLWNVNETIIRNNVFEENMNLGLLFVGGGDNCIFNNNFIDNGFFDDYYEGAQALEQLANENHNVWYDRNQEAGNYWSDLEWFVGATYEIEGSDSIDLYPLEHPIEI